MKNIIKTIALWLFVYFLNSCTPLEKAEIIEPNQLIEIPIIFHIWDGGFPVGSGPNISSSRINNQLNILNRYFASANIKFRLAKTNALGNLMSEPGINRNRGAFPSSKPNSEVHYDKQIINQTWDPNFYVNIFVTHNDVDPAATTLPESLKSNRIKGLDVGKSDKISDYPYTLAIHIPYKVLNGAFDQSNSQISVTVHEMGHYFGLLHIFNTDCKIVNDFCDDTSDYQDNGGTNFLINSRIGCNGVSYTPYNIMDYLPVQNRLNQSFTDDQIRRMRQCIPGCYFLRNLYKSTK